MEELVAQEIIIVIDILCKDIPKLQILLAPIINTDFNLQEIRQF